MSAEDFVKIVRDGNEKLRVDDVVVNAGSVKLRGRGILRVEQEKPLRIDLTLSGRNAPPSHRKVTTKKDFWSLSGMIDSHLRSMRQRQSGRELALGQRDCDYNKDTSIN